MRLNRAKLVIKVKSVIVVVLAILLSLAAFQVFRLRSELNKLTDKYNNLLTSHEQLQNNYNELQQKYRQLQGNYTALQRSYTTLKDEYENLLRPLRQARNLLKAYADMVSTHGLYSYVKDDYQKALEDEAQYLLWYSSSTPYYIDPRYYSYIIVGPGYSGEIVVSWDIQGSDYYVRVLDMSNFLDFASGLRYSEVDESYEDNKKPLYCNLEVGRMYAFVIHNKGSKAIKVNDWRIYEKVQVSVDGDLRKIFTANYFVATKVNYVPDIGDEAKSPLTTLLEGGDCEDRAILVASILLALGYDSSRIALALVDTDGDGISDHVSCLAQLPDSYDLEYLAHDLARLTLIFTNIDPYSDYLRPPNILLIPSSIVNGSNNYGYFIVIDPPDLTSGSYTAINLIPGYITFECYNILYAETIRSLLQ